LIIGGIPVLLMSVMSLLTFGKFILCIISAMLYFDVFSLLFQGLICCASDVLEGRGLVQVAITVAELLKFHHPRSPAHIIP
jgi:hypothetical protein